MKRVLIVDDTLTNLFLLRRLFEQKGVPFETAENGEIALKKALADPPGLILSDILMPVMDGYELCRRCKSDERLKHIPFVFYTATYKDLEDERFALSLGADRFIVKSSDTNRLFDLLREYLEPDSPAARPGRKTLGEEMEYFRKHNDVLFHKLEHKMASLEVANENLKALKERYQLSFENASDVILTFDLDARLISLTPSVERILGYKPEEFTGRSVSELARVFTPETFRQAADDARRILAGETVADRIYQFIARDGTVKTLEISGSPIIQGGEIVGMISVARDITARKKAEDDLRDSERKYFDLFQYLPIPVFEMDLEGNITAANQAMFETFIGTEADLKKGYNARQFISPEDAEKTARNVEKLIAGEIFRKTEYTFRRFDGSTFPALTVSKLVREDGRPSRIRGVIVDITERRQAEENVRRTNAFLDSIIENIPDMIFLKDARDLRFVRFNRAGGELLGYPPEEMSGKSDYDLFSKETADLHTATDRDVLRRKAPTDIPDERLQTRLKGERILHVRKAPILNPSGDPEYILGITEDITDRIMVEEALHKSEARFRHYFELPLVGMAIMSLDTSWIEVNDRLLEILGYTWAELKEKPWPELIHPDDRAADAGQFKRVLSGEAEEFSLDERLLRKDGRVIWASLAVGCARLADGTPDYFAVFLQDITLRKESQERVSKTLRAAVEAIAVTVETRDPYTAGHQRRVADLAEAIAVEMGIPPERVDGLRLAATIHDLGKISVPAEILSKPTKLQQTEFRLIQTHSQLGYEILKNIEFPWPIARMILEHHERIDGSGYPNRLTSDRLLPESIILMVADVVEAMASNRPYRPAVGLAEALAEVTRNRGITYDPGVVDACLRLFNEKGYRFQD